MQVYFLKFSIVFFKIPAAIISLSLIGLILLRVPEKSAGLASFANTSNLFGSPGQTERALDRIMTVGIILYLAICFILNIIINSN
jgi:protein translocase SecG subunit